jgi:UDPglucose--hexose-1-phosphate uridylyltransferase
LEPEESDFMFSEALDSYSEFRFDPLTGHWIIVAEGRSARPSNVVARIVEAPSTDNGDPLSDCAFCPGNECQTTPSVAEVVLREPDSDGLSLDDYEILSLESDSEPSTRRWFARALENRYPAFRVPERYVQPLPFKRARRRFCDAELPASKRFFQSIQAIGQHEVIVDASRHIRGWGEMTPLEICLAFRLFQERLRALRASARFEYAFLFKNVGVNAGASQRHTHGQLVASISTPDAITLQLERVARYEENRKKAGEIDSFWAALLKAELEVGKRIITTNDHFVLYCPYASRFPMQMEICPKFDGAFEDYDYATLDSCALMARDAIVALQSVYKRNVSSNLHPVDYNVVMTNAPFRVSQEFEVAARVFRPRFSIMPSLVKKAGYEYGVGIDINPVAPETAATILREYFQ